MDSNNIYLVILGMAIASYFTRQLPFVVLGKRKLSSRMTRWLAFIPVAVLSALLAPELFLVKIDGIKYFSTAFDNLYLWVGLATLVVAFVIKNFFVTIVFGMVLLSVARYLIN